MRLRIILHPVHRSPNRQQVHWTLDPFKTYNGCTLQTYMLNDDGSCDIVAKTEPYLSSFEENYQASIEQLDAMDVDSLAEHTGPKLAEAKKMFRPNE